MNQPNLEDALQALATIKQRPVFTCPPFPIRIPKSAFPEPKPAKATLLWGVPVEEDPTDPQYWLIRFDRLLEHYQGRNYTFAPDETKRARGT